MMVFILILIRVVVGGVFVYSGWHKLMAPIENFIAVLQGYQFLPSPLVSAVAFLVPWLEFIVGAFLLLPMRAHPSTDSAHFRPAPARHGSFQISATGSVLQSAEDPGIIYSAENARSPKSQVDPKNRTVFKA